eukprot:2588503-Prymnesium_polylepis.1
MTRGGDCVLVGGEQMLAVRNVRTGGTEFALQLDEGAKCVFATEHSLVFGAGASAVMYGKADRHFGWRERPSFAFVRTLLASDEYAVRTVTPLVAAHPLLVNTLDAASGKTVLLFFERSS